MATVAAQFTSTGPIVPDFATILANWQSQVMAIYGSDIDLGSDTQDGQFLASLAQAQSDLNQLAVAVYQAFSPATAQGAALSSVVKINGIQRNVASASVATITITGTVGTIILSGIVGDNLNLGTQWALPSSVTIPISGTISVLATCTQVGNTAAAPNTLTQILTPTQGWLTANNASAATQGLAVETDAALRQRQSVSVAIVAEGPVDPIFAAVANVVGVTRLAVYENTTNNTDSNGNISHSVAVVVQGGDMVAIASAIASKKPAGTGMNGTTVVTVTDPKGVLNTIQFFYLTLVTITVNVTIKTLPGFVTTTSNLIAQAIAQFISNLPIGTDSYLGSLFAPANLSGDAATAATGLPQAQLDALAATYFVVFSSMAQSRPSDAPPIAQDVPIAFNEAAMCTTANITVTIT